LPSRGLGFVYKRQGEGFGEFTVRAGIFPPVLDPARVFWE
ncbi:hypothetical protein, partial [Enterobacter hormaechei]